MLSVQFGAVQRQTCPLCFLLYLVVFVLDTPDNGKSLNGRLLTTPRISPLRGSLEAVPTCCDGLRHTTASTLDFMVGQEYHDPFRLLSPCGLQSRIYRQVVSLGRLYHNCRRAPTDVAAEFIARQRKERI